MSVPSNYIPGTVPRTQVGRLWASLACALVFLVVVGLQGFFRAGYDARQQAVSALCLGPGGWVQAGNFIFFGLAILYTVPVWRLVMAGGTGRSAYPWLTAVLGLSLIAVACFPQDPAPGYDPEGLKLAAPTLTGVAHLVLAAIAAVCSISNLLVMAARFRGDPYWRGWPLYSALMAVLMIVTVTAYACWSTQAGGFAGVFERIALLLPVIWTCTFVYRLHRRVPFIIVR